MRNNKKLSVKSRLKSQYKNKVTNRHNQEMTLRWFDRKTCPRNLAVQGSSKLWPFFCVWCFLWQDLSRRWKDGLWRPTRRQRHLHRDESYRCCGNYVAATKWRISSCDGRRTRADSLHRPTSAAQSSPLSVSHRLQDLQHHYGCQSEQNHQNIKLNGSCTS